MRPAFPRPRPASATLDPIRRAIAAHFAEMPGLSLTPAQARRLCGVQTVDTCAAEKLLDALVSEGLLVRSADGRYRRAA